MNFDELDIRYFLQTNIAQKKPKIKTNDIAICCPICKEGKSWNKKQRCHLFKKKNENFLVHCFNCGFVGNIERYLKIVNEDLYKDYIHEKRGYFIQKIKNEGVGKKEKIKFDDIKLSKPRFLFDIPKSFKSVYNTEAYRYLEKRKLEKYFDLFYYVDEDITINDKKLPIKNSIIIPLWYEKKLFGFQSRKVDRKRFYTFIPNQNSGLKVWNFFDLDLNNDIFIFEGVFDALSSGMSKKQITASLGIDYPEHLIKKMRKPIFCLDNPYKDESARQKLLKYVDKGYNVCVWDRNFKHIKDFNELLIETDENFVKKFILKNIEKGFKAKVKLKMIKGV